VSDFAQKKERILQVLTFTSLFPNAQFPNQNLFVRERIFALSCFCNIRVVAQVPLTPPFRWFGERYYRFSQIKNIERQGGLLVIHPRFFVFPKIFKILDGFLMALSVLGTLRRLRRKFQFDVIDAHWAYPDGVAAAILSKYFGVPWVLTVRGDDINVFARQKSRRVILRRALQSADLVIALSQELKRAVESLQVEPNAIVVSSNGVDPQRFYLMNQEDARRQLGLPLVGRILLSVGRLHVSKGHHILVEALGRLSESMPDVKLFIIGAVDHEGDARSRIRAAIERFHLHDRVQLVGPQQPSCLRWWYNAADLFCLATAREGSANVLLEAQACGLPCLTTSVGGNPEIICTPDLGMLMPPEPGAFADGIAVALARYWDREKICAQGLKRTWKAVGKECENYLWNVVLARRNSNMIKLGKSERKEVIRG